jgi:hypothetical protein
MIVNLLNWNAHWFASLATFGTSRLQLLLSSDVAEFLIGSKFNF